MSHVSISLPMDLKKRQENEKDDEKKQGKVLQGRVTLKKITLCKAVNIQKMT